MPRPWRCAACLLFLAVGCSRPGPKQVFVDPALATLIPPDTLTLTDIRLEELKKTPLWKKYLADLKLASLDRWRERTGLDPRENLFEILIASNNREAVALVRGKFVDEVGKEPRMDTPGAKRTTYKGYLVIENEGYSLLFMNASVAVAGPSAAVHAVLDRRGGASAVGVPAAIQAKLDTVPHDVQFWAIATQGADPFSLDLPERSNLNNFKRLFASVQSLVLYADLRQGLHLIADGTTGNATESKRLYDTLKGFLGLARLSTPTQQTALLAAYDAIKVEQKESAVHLDTTLTEAQAEQIMSLFQR